MPLPAALLARLKKRGIIDEQQQQKSNEEVEEVFAEDYDDPHTENTAPPATEPAVESVDNKGKPLVHEVSACPNRSNRYHTCVEYCLKRYGSQKFEAAPLMLKRRERMLRRYPLPEGWEEVADPQTNRYYYWNTITDQVCWLSPVHPRANITVSAQRIQDLFGEQVFGNKDASDEEMETNASEESEGSSSSSSSSSDSEDEYEKRRRDRGRRQNDNRGRGRKRQKEELDPMDPASYSEVPRGTWSTGLASRGDAKTGADTTASGPLFQQRPYPSPGEILRRNRDQT
uniref:Polyglutamine-binding protein 1 n=1 Tax=Crassostrea virginica TaxID=6565 RepID=A0A8B8AZX0_CRAVI|nr:polyglutamine-binding protein 1-like [Crassostrea virginica]XP_022301575.1 polyglutamine-binding protein 1-like [Crassostrea virginica]